MLVGISLSYLRWSKPVGIFVSFKVCDWKSIHAQPASNAGDSAVESTCIIEHLLCALLGAKLCGFKGKSGKQRPTCKPIMSVLWVLLWKEGRSGQFCWVCPHKASERTESYMAVGVQSLKEGEEERKVWVMEVGISLVNRRTVHSKAQKRERCRVFQGPRGRGWGRLKREQHKK